jgi:hypothetical protein
MERQTTMKCIKHKNKEAIGVLAIWSGYYGGGEALVNVCEECMQRALHKNGSTSELLNKFLKD